MKNPHLQHIVQFEHIEAMMATLLFKYERIAATTTTVCYAFLPDGFRIGHGDSACVDPANYNYEDGKKYAKQRAIRDAYDNLWQLEGYLLHRTGRVSDTWEYEEPPHTFEDEG